MPIKALGSAARNLNQQLSLMSNCDETGELQFKKFSLNAPKIL